MAAHPGSHPADAAIRVKRSQPFKTRDGGLAPSRSRGRARQGARRGGVSPRLRPLDPEALRGAIAWVECYAPAVPRGAGVLSALASGLLAALEPAVAAATEPLPVLDRFYHAWRDHRGPCRGEPAGSECLTIALASPARRGDTLTVILFRPHGRPPEPGALEPTMLATGTIVGVSRGPPDPDLPLPPPRYRDAALSVRQPLPGGTSTALVAASGDVPADRVGAVSLLPSDHPDVAAYRRRFARRLAALGLPPLEATEPFKFRIDPEVFRISPPGRGPAWDFVVFEWPKVGSHGFGVDLGPPKRPVLFEEPGLSDVLSVTDLDGDGTFEIGLAWSRQYYVGRWEVRLFDGKKLGRRKVLRTWAD
jgi:hypothetical protein